MRTRLVRHLFVPLRLSGLALLAIVGPGSVLAAAPATVDGAPAWNWTPGDKVLKVLNVEGTMRTPGLDLDDFGSFWAVIARQEPRDSILPGLRSDWPGLVTSPIGAIVVVLQGKGDAVRLLALESESGIVRWQRSDLEIGDNCGLFVIGNTLLVRALQQGTEKTPGGRFVLLLLDLRDGRELWRNGAIKEKGIELLAFARPRVLLVRTLRMLGSPVRIYALDLDTGQVRWTAGVDHDADAGFPLWAYQGTRETVSDRYEWKSPSVFYQDAGNFASYPRQANDLFLVTLVKPDKVLGKMGYALERWDLDTGRVRWSRPVSRVCSLYVDESRLFVLTYANLTVLDRESGTILAEWFPHLDREKGLLTEWTLAPEAQFLRLVGGLLCIHQPVVMRYQFKTLDAGSGSELWEARLSAGPFLLREDGILTVVDSSLALVDPRSGRVVRSVPIPFGSQANGVFPGAAGSVLVRSDNRLVRVDGTAWKAVFDTGEIPLPKVKRSAWGEFFGSLLVGAFAGAISAHGQAGAPPDVSLVFGAVQAQAALLSRANRSTDGDTLRIQGMGSDGAFFVTGESGDLRMLRVDTRSGERSARIPLRLESDVETVFDDFRGVVVEFTKRGAVARRYHIGDEALRTNRYSDAFGWGLEALRRADGLDRAGRASDALAELQRAHDRLLAALGHASDARSLGASRLELATTCLRLAKAIPPRAGEFRDEARSQLTALLDAAPGTPDESDSVLLTRARDLLAQIPR